ARNGAVCRSRAHPSERQKMGPKTSADSSTHRWRPWPQGRPSESKNRRQSISREDRLISATVWIDEPSVIAARRPRLLRITSSRPVHGTRKLLGNLFELEDLGGTRRQGASRGWCERGRRYDRLPRRVVSRSCRKRPMRFGQDATVSVLSFRSLALW